MLASLSAEFVLEVYETGAASGGKEAAFARDARTIAERAGDPLQPDEPGAATGQTAHQPLHGPVALDIAAETLRAVCVREPRLALDLVVGVLAPRVSREDPIVRGRRRAPAIAKQWLAAASRRTG